MAYTATVTGPADLTLNGERHYSWSIAETECASGSEWEIPIPFVGPYTITLLVADKTAGTATTIQPELGDAASWVVDAAGHVDKTAAAAAHVYNATDVRVRGKSTRILRGRSMPDAGADNTIATTVVLRPGHV